MKRSTEERLFSFGCLVVLVGVGVFGYLAFSSRWKYSGGIAGLIGSVVFICWIRVKRDDRRHHEALIKAFVEAGLPLPEIKVQNTYGFPFFTLTFESEAALQQPEASGGIASFRQVIQNLYGDIGPKRQPFNAERAIYATYTGRR